VYNYARYTGANCITSKTVDDAENKVRLVNTVASDFLHLDLSHDQEYEIYSLDSRLKLSDRVLSGNPLIDISDLPVGFYFF
jgi:hypothetical protein